MNHKTKILIVDDEDAILEFMLAALTHALVIVMPGLLIVYEMSVRGTRFTEALRRTWLFFVPAAFAALLRVLDEGVYHRVGDTRPSRADFRLVCATCRDLPALVETGKFRRDLFYRIHGGSISIDTSYNGGTRFRFSLPVAVTEKPEPILEGTSQ